MSTRLKSSLFWNRSVQRACVPLITAVICFVAMDRSAMQAPTAADGPWAGWAQCVLTGQFTGQGQTYFHQQTHTWMLTSSTPGPTSSAAIKQYAATWQVTGHGTRQRGQGNNNDQWTTAGQPMADTITIRLTAEGTVRFGGAAQLRSVGTTTGAAIPYVDEWTFPVIEGAATQTSITGSAPQGLSANFTGAPPGTTSTVTCSWNFLRGGGAPPPPPGGTTAAGPPPTPITAIPAPLATATAGPTQPTAPATLSSSTPTKAPIGPVAGLTADPGPCKLAGPVVLSDKTVATPGSVDLAWNRDPFTNILFLRATDANVVNVEYTVTRTDLGDAPLGGGLASYQPGSPVPANQGDPVTFRHLTKMDDYRITYVYKIRARHFHQTVHLVSAGSVATNYFPVYTATATYEDGCGETQVSITPPRAQTPVLTNIVNARGAVAINWKMPSDQLQTGFLVLGAGLPADGKTVAQTRGEYAAPCCSIQISDLPAGSQSWLIAPIWDTPNGRAIDASTGLRVSQTIAPWTSTPGPAPTGIQLQAFPNSDVIQQTCSVSIKVTWAPVPGAIGYTVSDESGPVSPRIPLTTFSFFYRQADMVLPDLVKAAITGASSPAFTRGLQVRVVASFTDRPDGASAFVPLSFSTYPCWDRRYFPGDTQLRNEL